MNHSITHFQTVKPSIKEKAPEASKIIATGVGINIRHKEASENVVKENDPNDPLVAKKVLDALSLDLIKFNQRERDALASILSGRADAVRETRV